MKYIVTKCSLNDDNLLFLFPTEVLDSMNEVLEYSQDFFNNKKIYQTHECGSNESIIKCVSDERNWIHIMEENRLRRRTNRLRRRRNRLRRRRNRLRRRKRMISI